MTENFAFVLLLNKKSVNDLTQKNSSISCDIFYYYTNVFESRITQDKIWFTKNLNTSKKRFQRVQKTAKIHHAWKIQSRKNDQIKCRTYLEKRIEWEYNLVRQALNIAKLKWFITYDKKKILRIAHSFKINSSIDVENVVKKDDFFQFCLFELFKYLTSRQSVNSVKKTWHVMS
jgi:hypothetical protein